MNKPTIILCATATGMVALHTVVIDELLPYLIGNSSNIAGRSLATVDLGGRLQPVPESGSTLRLLLLGFAALAAVKAFLDRLVFWRRSEEYRRVDLGRD